MSEGMKPQTSEGAPGALAPAPAWRSERFVRLALQAVFLLGALAVAAFFYRNMIAELERLGLGLGFGFLQNEAGFGISEGIAYQPSDSYARALVVGIVNTLRVVIASIICATAIGLVVGIARLSSNWLVRNLARGYVELFRNVPLLLQLLFWYTGVILKLPPVRESVELFGGVFLNQRGLYMPRMIPTEALGSWLWFVAAGAAVAVVVAFRIRRRLEREDRPGFPILYAIPAWLAVALIGRAIAGAPFTFELPELQRFNFAGGTRLSPEFVGLFLGLSVYTGAFIAEVVRGGIQAVHKGQREAAAALGLRPFEVMVLIVIPQAFRVIIPPMTSQYLNLAKNSSLAIAIGYPDLFNIGTTTMNQTGQTVPIFFLIMVLYLTLSLVTSAFMNAYNRRLRLTER